MLWYVTHCWDVQWTVWCDLMSSIAWMYDVNGVVYDVIHNTSTAEMHSEIEYPPLLGCTVRFNVIHYWDVQWDSMSSTAEMYSEI